MDNNNAKKKNSKPGSGGSMDKIEHLPVSSLVPYARNSRTHSDAQIDQIAASIKEFGFCNPVLIDADGGIIAGHGRVMAATRAKLKTVPCLRLNHLTETQRRAYVIADNQIALNAGWDESLLAAELEALGEFEFDTDLLAFNADLADEPDAELFEDAEPQISRADELMVLWGTKVGQLWSLGSHRLLCGDSTNAEEVNRLMDGKKAFLMSTDPPYGVDFKGAKYNPRAKVWDGIANDELQGDDLEGFISALLETWLPHCEEASAFYFWTAAMQEGAAAAAAVRKSGLHIQSQIIWNKNCLVLGQADYHWKHENCWYAFWKGKKHRWFGERKQTTVWDVSKVSNSAYVHPMQKPTELYAIPIRNHTKEGEIVLEPFSGSGSQLMAAEQLNRKCYGMEISPAYVAVILQRFQDATGKTPVLVEDV